VPELPEQRSNEGNSLKYCFRHRLLLSAAGKLDVPEAELCFWEDADGRRVSLRAIGENASIRDCERLALWGEGFDSEEQARDAAQRWRGVVERSWAATRIAADFGDRAAQGGVGLALKQELETKFGGQVLSDRHGLVVFECQPPPIFMGMSGAGLTVVAGESWFLALAAAQEVGPLDERSRLAYDIFSASFFVASSPDARLMLLVMALETLIDQNERASEVRDHVDQLITCTKLADIEAAEKDSILGSLEWLKRESISQAGRRLVGTLGEQQYGGLTPRQLFRQAYDMRSRLAHGHVPRPTRQEVGALAAKVELMVASLLAGPEVTAALQGETAP
jgi:hypothetical protein